MASPEDKAVEALKQAFGGASTLDEKNRVPALEDNLLGGMDSSLIAADFLEGAGNELGSGNIRSVRSSAALAANCFGPWRSDPSSLTLLGMSQFTSLRFEGKCPSELVARNPNAKPPHLDVLVRGPQTAVAVESKLLEYFRLKQPKFTRSYSRENLPRRDEAWYVLMETMQSSGEWKRLDAAQLVKHYFGLTREFPQGEVHLLYLFWEPTNADGVRECREHRDEVELFAERVEGTRVRFHWMTYSDLWRQWNALESPEWLTDHVRRLRERYEVSI